MEKVIARTWEEVANMVKSRALSSSYGEAHVIVRLVEMDVEAADGERVNDAYEGLVEYDADDNLSGVELVEAIRESYRANEKYLKEYKTERGAKNFISRSAKVSYVDGVIVQ